MMIHKGRDTSESAGPAAKETGGAEDHSGQRHRRWGSSFFGVPNSASLEDPFLVFLSLETCLSFELAFGHLVLWTLFSTTNHSGRPQAMSLIHSVSV